MFISNICSTNFNGLWKFEGVLEKENGIYYKNKAMYTVHKFTYHPWEDESAEAIEKQIDKHFAGRSFSLWDNFDNHNKADLFQMNYIKTGAPIKKSEKKALLAKGYNESFSGGILDDNSFMMTYSNEAYSPFDIVKMRKEKVKQIVDKHFNLNA